MTRHDTPVHILLIGGSAQDAQHLRQLLSRNGGSHCRLERAAGLDAGLKRLGKGRVHLVLFELSKTHGLSEFVRARTHVLDVPFVVLAHPRDEPLAVEAVQKGAQDYLLLERLNPKKLMDSIIRHAIDQHRLAEQVEVMTGKLQASEASFANLIDSATDGVVVLDRKSLICFVNPSAEALLGRPAKELLGTACEFPLTNGKVQEWDVVRVGQAGRTVEVRLVETVWEGRPAWLASLHEISERKRVERLKDEFVSKVSHELRTPLTSIKGAVTLMLQRAMGAINEEQEDFLNTISQDIDRLAGLINNLLDLSKIEAGKMSLARQRVDLAALIEQACRSHHALFGTRQVLRQVAQVPPVYADRNLILQVIGNLIGNAVKFTPEQGTITFALSAQGESARLTIADNGPGIPPETVGKLFQKFVQADHGSGADLPKGTGLGLAICREIVELHHGQIWVTSELGQGSAFTFTLPIYEPSTTFHQIFDEAKRVAEKSKSELSLIVIDLSALREAVGRIEGKSAHEVLLAFEDVVRKSVARTDHVLMTDPLTILVLASADQRGAAAIQQRLRDLVGPWWEKTAGAGSGHAVGIGRATYPLDGTQLDALLKRAKASGSGRQTEERG